MSEHYFSASPSSPDRPQRIVVELNGDQVEVGTGSGVFSGSRLDQGTTVLLRHLHRTGVSAPAGDVLDLGCGWGPIALAMARSSPTSRVWAVDVNERALALTAANAGDLGLDVRVATPENVPPEVRFAAIWSNPPVRIGKPALRALLRAWLPRLCEGGEAWLVVQRNLGADSLQAWLQESLPRMHVERAASAKGFRILHVAAAI